MNHAAGSDEDLYFSNRRDAGKCLAEALSPTLRQRPGVVVLGLARGGVPVGYEVARALNSPLEVLNVRKLGVPGHEELAFGAIAPGPITVFIDSVIRDAGLRPADITSAIEHEWPLLLEREKLYRPGMPPIDLTGRTAVFVDDGLATGATMRAALRWAEDRGAAACIVAAPVGSADTCEELLREKLCESCCCVCTPQIFMSVGEWYEDFAPVSDREVIELLHRRRREMRSPYGGVRGVLL